MSQSDANLEGVTSTVSGGHSDSQESSNTTEVRKKKCVSERKIEANRHNALKSTGPVTVTGKMMISRNAVKHGILARELVITDPDGKESQDEFDELVSSVSEYYTPVGFVEQLWVNKIAVCIWRNRRLLRYESGNIAIGLAQHRANLRDPRFKALRDLASNADIDAMVDHLSLPPTREMDLIIRYGTMIDKELRNAATELDKLQCRRKEQTVDDVPMSTSKPNGQ